MMPEFRNKIEIAASPSQIWSILIDFEKWPQWSDSFSALQRLDDGPVGLGSRIRIKQPRLFPRNWTITEWNPDNSFSWISKGGGVTSFANHWIETDRDVCTFHQSMNISGFLGRPTAILLKATICRYMDMEAAGLKDRSERRDQLPVPE
ncbi:SRPBCC domain-containing protein [Parasphingorhabdus halotolerans]|uniref:SRPBCC domain-containing protein n=1 Tax=Parasphingorhabdus halotolerans TaxID=2725558 RepID=A0A6H2DNU6_9SPHN|nr:SRPBCC domain-containing protein [Parasphingorhabdus halotolerans]QJB70060.1 SRPBCC domain-containing protein [Parasphingorhabdus halotolerans]